MSKSKYIIFDDNGIEIPVVFSPLIKHERFAYLKPISAGFCKCAAQYDNRDIYDEEKGLKWRCFGESNSLNLKSRPKEDAEILNNLLEYDI